MRDLLTLAIHLVVTFAKLLRPGGVRAVAAESLLLEHQLLNSNRPRQRAPNLTSVGRIVLGFATLFARPHRLPKLGALVKPATLLKFHKALADRKYWRLFSSCHRRRKPGPKGPSAELIAAIIELKRPNPRFGCIRIAQQVSYAFGIETDKDVVRRVLANQYRPGDSGTDGPSWLTFIAHAKESLWSADLFRCESILLRSHWVLVVMDVFTRRIVGLGIEHAAIDGVSVCRMSNRAIAGERLPKHLSTNRDPLFRFHRWLANLRVLEIDEIKSVPYAPIWPASTILTFRIASSRGATRHPHANRTALSANEVGIASVPGVASAPATRTGRAEMMDALQVRSRGKRGEPGGRAAVFPANGGAGHQVRARSGAATEAITLRRTSRTYPSAVQAVTTP